jgi:phosphate transport system substrate-binding protein
MKYLVIAALFIIAASCSESKSKFTDTYQSGSIAIGVDPAFMPIIDLEASSFEAAYPNAKIKALEMGQDQAVALMMTDSVRLAITDRDFTTEERAKMKEKNYLGRQVKLATDAIAIILNPENKDSAFTLAQIKQVLNGEVNDWSLLNPKNQIGKITAVFDKEDGSNLSFLSKKLGLDKSKLSKSVYAVNTNAEVVNYVAKNKNAIGFVGVKYVLNPNDSTQQKFNESIKVAYLGDTIKKDEENFHQPYQAYLAMKKYPLTREVFILIKESRQGLPASFVNYVCSDPGQRIILRAGLLPATSPVRVVSIK